MHSLNFGLEDIRYHVVTIGMDIYQPIDIGNDLTRLNMFYEKLNEGWGTLYSRLVTGGKEFKISGEFRKNPKLDGPRLVYDTFIMTNRGPVFHFPIVLPDPVLETGLESNYLEIYEQVEKLFFAAIPGRKKMRLGMVREIVFSTGNESCNKILSNKQSFVNANLIGGNKILCYRDDFCNVRIQVEPVEIVKTTKLEVGATVSQRDSCGLKVILDVNNADLRPLEDSDIEKILSRAGCFWPDELLQYINEE